MQELVIVLVGGATSLVMRGITAAAPFVKSLPAFVRTLVVVVLGMGVAVLAQFVDMPLPADPTTWDATVVNGLLTALSAMGLHAAAKAVVPKT
jgi:uncharacterized membrane protein